MEAYSVFAYGSLMWNPGFEYLSARPARLNGYRRVLNVLTTEHRGSEEFPGLVFNLSPNPDASTFGVVYTVGVRDMPFAKRYLDHRERISDLHSYDCNVIEVDGVPTYTYLVPETSKFVFSANLYERAKIIATASGSSGSNLDYLMSCIHYLRRRGEIDHELELLAACATEQSARCFKREASA